MLLNPKYHKGLCEQFHMEGRLTIGQTYFMLSCMEGTSKKYKQVIFKGHDQEKDEWLFIDTQTEEELRERGDCELIQLIGFEIPKGDVKLCECSSNLNLNDKE